MAPDGYRQRLNSQSSRRPGSQEISGKEFSPRRGSYRPTATALPEPSVMHRRPAGVFLEIAAAASWAAAAQNSGPHHQWAIAD